MQLFRKRKKAGWLALCNTSEGLSVAQVTRGNAGKPGVSICALRQNPQDDSQWKALAQEMDLDQCHCILLLAAAEYRIMQLDAPAVPQEELKQAVRWRIKDMLDYPVEAATIDVIEIPADPNSPGRQKLLYVIAARNEVISERIDRYMVKAGAGLEVIDIPELAQRNIATQFEEAGRSLAMLSFSAAGGLLTFTAGGELYQSRQIEVTLAQLQTEDEERQSHIFDRVVLELQRSLDNFERQFPHLPVSRLLLAPFPAREVFREFIVSYLGLRVESFSLEDIFDMQDSPVMQDLADQAQVMGVLGAALRQEMPA